MTTEIATAEMPVEETAGREPVTLDVETELAAVTDALEEFANAENAFEQMLAKEVENTTSKLNGGVPVMSELVTLIEQITAQPLSFDVSLDIEAHPSDMQFDKTGPLFQFSAAPWMVETGLVELERVRETINRALHLNNLRGMQNALQFREEISREMYDALNANARERLDLERRRNTVTEALVTRGDQAFDAYMAAHPEVLRPKSTPRAAAA